MKKAEEEQQRICKYPHTEKRLAHVHGDTENNRILSIGFGPSSKLLAVKYCIKLRTQTKRESV